MGREGHSLTGYFAGDSVICRVNRERVVAYAGARALLMQSAHPVAVAGLLAHTGSLQDPWTRLVRTAKTMQAITFGSRQMADRSALRVREMHKRARGVLKQPAGPYPAGTPYAADDPELLLWVLATLADSVAVVHMTYVGPLDKHEREALWRDYRVVGRLFGLADHEMPDTDRAMRSYIEEMLSGDRLYVTEEARDLAIRVVMNPPVPFYARGLAELANFATIGLLPEQLRRQFGFPWSPLHRLVFSASAGYARRVVLPMLPGRIRRTAAAVEGRSPALR